MLKMGHLQHPHVFHAGLNLSPRWTSSSGPTPSKTKNSRELSTSTAVSPSYSSNLHISKFHLMKWPANGSRRASWENSPWWLGGWFLGGANLAMKISGPNIHPMLAWNQKKGWEEDLPLRRKKRSGSQVSFRGSNDWRRWTHLVSILQTPGRI